MLFHSKTKNTAAEVDVLSPADRPIPMRRQLAYALNELASNPIYTISLSFLTFFYTDVLGMEVGLVGLIILVSKIFDGISDLWAGNLIDHTHTKSGSARPWVLRSAVLMAAAYVLLFAVPDCGTLGKAVYIFVTYNFAMTIAFTILNCAINALPVYMSNHSASRASAYSIRMIFAGLVQMIFSMLCLNIVDALGGGQRGWILMAAIFATISFVVCVLVYFGTRETVTEYAALPKGESLPFSFIANGDVAEVLAVRNVHEQYGFRFADVTLRFPDYDGQELDCRVLLSTLQSEAPALTADESRRLYEAVLEDYAHISTKKERMKALRSDAYYNALQIKYAYAVTCHKAQGGQWRRVYIDQGYLPPDALGVSYLRWLYTAFTRTSDRLYLVNWPEEQRVTAP